MKVFGVKCPRCKDVIVSYYTHDYKHCKCGYSMIDGGRDYTRTGYGVGAPHDGKLTKKDWAEMERQNREIGIPEMIEVILPDKDKTNVNPARFPY